MKPYQILMALALVGSAALVLFGDATPESDIAEAVQRPRPAGGSAGAAAVNSAQNTTVASATAHSTTNPLVAPSVASARTTKGASEPVIQRLIPRAVLVGESGEATFAAGEGVFQGQNWNPPPPPPPPVANVPPPPPMAPPLPFAVIGKALADGAWEVYLTRGDKTYVARPHSIIDGSYRVEKIAPPTMSITYLPLNQVQQMNIGALD